jgi:hypothetical protein
VDAADRFGEVLGRGVFFALKKIPPIPVALFI